MLKDTISTLFNYNYWANARILKKAGELSDAQLTDPTDHSHGSLRELLFHMLRTEWVWRNLCQTGAITQAPPSSDDFPTLQAIKDHWQDERELMRAFLASLSSADMDKEMQLQDPRGNTHTYRMWQMMMHLNLHSMQHRSEVAAILTGYNHSPGDIDFIFYLAAQDRT